MNRQLANKKDYKIFCFLLGKITTHTRGKDEKVLKIQKFVFKFKKLDYSKLIRNFSCSIKKRLTPSYYINY